MRIGVFSKFDMAGGSERRCVEMVNALVKFTHHEAWLLAERGLPDGLSQLIAQRVHVRKHLFDKDELAASILYELDIVLVVNTDSKEFCQEDYWLGRSSRHAVQLKLSKLPRMAFLFNFIVSPSRHLHRLAAGGVKIGIITANRKFHDEIGEQDRYALVRHLPRIALESPIDPATLDHTKTPSEVVRIGMHSTAAADKWNVAWPELVESVNARCGADRVAWRFMGMPRTLRDRFTGAPNVEALAEYARPVREFLRELDVFVFFTSWKREEAWSRSVAEALTSGCPVVATPRGGNRDQIVSGNNGLLCDSFERFVEGIVAYVQDPERRLEAAKNAQLRAREYSSEAVIHKFVRFVEEAL